MRRSAKYLVLASLTMVSLGFLGLVVHGTLLQAPSSGTWAPAPGGMAEARANAAAATLADGSVLVTGGDSVAGTAVASAELFSLDGSFYAVAPMSFPRSHHVAVALKDGRVLVAGGNGVDGNASNSAEIFDPTSGAWQAAGAMLEPRSGATATRLSDGKVLIAGGDSSGTASMTLEVFDPTSDTFVPAGIMSSARKDHAAALLAGNPTLETADKVLLAGGSDGTAALASTEIWDAASGAVVSGPALSVARSGLSATTLLDGSVLIAGGAGASGEVNTTEVFSPASGLIELASSQLSSPRQKHLAIFLPHNSSVLFVGGTAAGAPVSAVELYMPWAGGFVSTGQPGLPRADAAASTASEGMLVVAGGKDAAGALSSSAEVYGFATLKTDKDDYAPGDIVTITGLGWESGDDVILTLHETNNPVPHPDRVWIVTADSNGQLLDNSFYPEEHDLGVRFILTAEGARSQAQATFTDANRQMNVVSLAITSPAGAVDRTMNVSQAFVVRLTYNVTGATALNPWTSIAGTLTVPAGWSKSSDLALASLAVTTNQTFDWTVTPSATPGSGAVSVSLTGTPPAGDSCNSCPFSGSITGGVTSVNPALLSFSSFTAAKTGSPGTTTVVVGDSLTVTMTVANGAAPRATANAVSPSALGITPTGTATAGVCSGASPAGPNNLVAGASQAYTYTCTPVSGNGTLTLGGSASGTDQNTAAAVSTGAGSSNSVTVTKATPVITWANPANITYPTALSGTQLNATASVPGSFVYTPAATTVLNAGNGQTLHVDFTPTDTANYNNASKDVTINVLKANQTITFTTPAPASAVYNTNFTVAATGGGSGNPVTFSASGVCTNLLGVYTMTSGTGTCTVRADQAGNSNYNAATQATASVTAQKASQTISFSINAPATAVYNTNFTVAASATSGLAVAYSNAGVVCSNVGALYTMTSGTGTCTVRADQAGDSNYSAATQVTQSTTAQKADQTITFSIHAPATATFGGNFTVAAAATSSLAVAYSSAGACSNAAAVYTMTSGTGTCSVKADQAGNNNYNAAPQVSESTTAQKAATTLTVNDASGTYGGTVNLHAQLTSGSLDTSGLTVTFSLNGTPDGGDSTNNVGNAIHNGEPLGTIGAGTYPTGVGASFATNANFQSSNASAQLTVSQATPAFSNLTASQTIVYGTASINLSGTISAPGTPSPVYPTAGETVNITINGVTHPATIGASGAFSLSFDTHTIPVSVSAYPITYAYAGDVNFNAAPNNAATTLTVNKANTTAAITSDDPDPSLTTQAVTVKFTVSVTAPGAGTPTGNVHVTDGVSSCDGTLPTLQCDVTLATAGARTLTATYQGDTNFNASPASTGEPHQVLTPATLTVQAAATAAQSGAPGDTILKTGQNATVTVSIKNTGTSGANTVVAPSLTFTPTGTATSVACGAGSGSATIAGGATESYTYTCGGVSGDGTLTFSNSSAASGKDATSSQSITGTGTATSNSITVDSTNPDVSITPASGNVTAPFTFNWSLADPTAGGVTSGVDGGSCTLKIDAAAPVAVPCTSSNSSLLTGTHDVVVSGSDNAGNTNSASRHYILDDKPPVVTVTFPANDGSNGWFKTSPVTGSVTANDTTTGNSNVTAITCVGGTVGSITGLGTTSASAPLTVSAEGSNSVSCQATDSSGNTGAYAGSTAMPVVVKIDTVKPAASATPNRLSPDHNTWYNQALTIHFSGTDATSLIASCTADNVYSTPDSATASATGTCTDNAGNVSDPAPFNFKYDGTGPTSALSVTAGTAGTNGWYTSDVTVHAAGTDSLSFPVTCSADVIVNTETAGQVVNGSCTNDAGLSTDATALTVKLDKTAPTAGLAVSAGTAGANGWYTSDVTVHASGADSISSPVSCTSDQLISTEGAAVPVNGSCTNEAGLSTNASELTLKIDKTGPTATLAVTVGTLGANGWYTSNVTVHTDGSDSISGIESCAADQFQNTETAGSLFNGSCTNNAGLTTNASPLTVKLDKTAPTNVVLTPSGTLGDNNWYTSNVSIHTSGDEDISTPVVCSGDQSQNTDTTGTPFDGDCTNNAGLTTHATQLSVKRDATAPIVAITPDRSADHTGWYNHALTFTNPGTDATSGIASCTTPGAYSTPDNASASVSADCTDNAGNVGHGNFGFMYDETAPTGVAVSPDRAADHNGWYNHAFTATWSGADATSGIDSCTTNNYSGPESASGSIDGHCTDVAGNASSDVAFAFKYDATAPTVDATASRPADHNGWYNHALSIHFAGTDSVSGIEGCDPDENYSTPESAAASSTGHCTNGAGLVGTGTLNFMYDSIAPTGVSGAPDHTPDHNGWYNAAFHVVFTGTDATSTIDTCSTVNYAGPDGTGKKASGTCTDKAGNTSAAVDSSLFDYDATAPVLTLVFTPNGPDGTNGWWKTPGGVPFAWTCSDATSGIDGSFDGGCPSPLTDTVTANGTRNFSDQVKDLAGNLSVAVNRDLKLDNIAPVITWNLGSDVCSLVGNAGWCRGTQTADFTANDAPSGLANPLQAHMTPSTGTNGNPINIPSGAVLDLAGNSNPGINAGPYKIDNVAPTISLVDPAEGGNFTLNAALAAHYTCTDPTPASGVANCTGNVPNGSNFSTTPVGPHTFTVNATDVAGNPATAVTNHYNVQYNFTGFRPPVDNYPVVNLAKAGQTIPVKWQLLDAGGNLISDLASLDSMNSGPVACNASLPSDIIQEVASPGSTVFRFDGSQFIFNWQTVKGQTGCRTFQIKLHDGTVRWALFQFK